MSFDHSRRKTVAVASVITIAVLAAVFDVATYLYAADRYAAFETNPLKLIGLGMWVVFALKAFVVVASSWVLIRCPNLSLTFLVTLCVLHGAYAQFIGGIANMSIVKAAPPPEAVLSTSEAVSAYSFFVLGYYIIPVVIGAASFWLWKNMHGGKTL